jgi:hypothetical protein
MNLGALMSFCKEFLWWIKHYRQWTLLVPKPQWAAMHAIDHHGHVWRIWKQMNTRVFKSGTPHLATFGNQAKLWAWVGAVGLGMAFLPVWCNHVLGVPTHMQGRKWSPSGTRALERKWCAPSVCCEWLPLVLLVLLLLPGTISLSDLQGMQVLWHCSHMNYCYGQVNPARLLTNMKCKRGSLDVCLPSAVVGKFRHVPLLEMFGSGLFNSEDCFMICTVWSYYYWRIGYLRIEFPACALLRPCSVAIDLIL